MNQSNYNPYGYGQQSNQGYPAQDGSHIRPGSRAYSDAYREPPGLMSKLKSPAFMTVGVLAFATLLGFMVFSYLTSSSPETSIEPLPVIEPDRITYKMQPEDPEGMDVPYEQSAAFDVLRDPDQRREREDFALDERRFPDQDSLAQAEDEISQPVRDITARQTPPENVTLLQGPEEPALGAELDQPSETASRPQRLHSAGSSPDTIAYVRSVLENEQTEAGAQQQETAEETVPESEPDAQAVQDIEPAAGAAAPTMRTIKPGSHYLQLSSVTSRQGAEKEWNRLQKELDSYLTGLDHRIQEANLGERGTYYRIQVGPMSKESADALCSDIKAQKSGGCLVIK